MVVLAGLMGRENASSDRVLTAVETGEVRIALSDDGLRELNRVSRYLGVEARMSSPARALRVGLSMGLMGELYRPAHLEWTAIPDRGDWWLLDLAFEANVDYIVTRNERHLGLARSYGFEVIQPPQLLAELRASR